MKNRLYRIWRASLPFVFVVILVHFIKDITQDILKIPTPLDLLGDVQEDLSAFPESIHSVFIGLGVGSFVTEAFLLVSILVIMKKAIRSLEKTVGILLTILFLYFLVAVLLDPRFSIAALLQKLYY